MTGPVRFDLTDESSSIERARETPVEVVTDPSGESYLVAFEDSEDGHDVLLIRGPDSIAASKTARRVYSGGPENISKTETTPWC